MYFKLNCGLLWYTNQKHQIIKNLTTQSLERKDSNDIAALTDYLFTHPSLIDLFVQENPLKFNSEEVQTINGWKKFVKGNFFIMAHLKDYSVLLAESKDAKVYGVLGLHSTLEEVTPPFLPNYIETTLVPFKGKIVYCGIIRANNISFGGGISRTLNQDYQRAKSIY